MIYLNGKSLLKEQFVNRRGNLRSSFTEDGQRFMFAKYRDFDDISQIDQVIKFLSESVKDQCEGLMIKNVYENSTYEPSKRSSNWFKLKKDYMRSGVLSDSLDLVVVGADWGKGRRTGVFGSFLLACYDPESKGFQTVTKVATGLSDQIL